MQLPDPGVFVWYDEEPVQINGAEAEYPQKAQRDRIEGYVIVQAYVDTTGKVLKASALYCSLPGYGFEEAAVRAAYKTRWQPARSLGIPVAVWVAYKYDFVMR